MQDNHRSVQVLNALKEMGIKISLDDFGTGYSSLAHLKIVEIDTLMPKK
jgi:EAL domain-containing protein (putative c-di-GMP-specific phosphodiesterase class I)